MNINDMKLGDVLELVQCLKGSSNRAADHPFVGRFVLCRCESAGVHVGELASLDGGTAVLKNSKRLWSWKAIDGVALSGVAQHGLKDGKIDSENPTILLNGVIEVIPVSDAARRYIDEC